MKALIYSPAKSPMQSAPGKTDLWVLECDSAVAKSIDPVMGWVSAGDTSAQIHLSFPTLEAAEVFAQGKKLDYKIAPLQERKVKPRNYADAFVYIAPEKQEST